MAYNDDIVKTQLPTFAELYDFYFPQYVINVTNYPKNISYNNTTYIATVMQRSEFTAEKGNKREITVTFATKESSSLDFLVANVPKIRLVLRRLFLPTQSIKTLFVGEGEAVGVEGRTVTFKAEDILMLNQTLVPQVVYSAYCNATLYDGYCGVLNINFRDVTTVSASGSVIKASIFGSKPADWYTYGYVEYNGKYRMITKHDQPNSQCYLHMPFDENIDGQQVIVYAGCDKTPATCQNKFNNLARFKGFPYIPTKNPVIWGFK